MKSLNILIVEDESLLALDLSMQLKKKGANVVDYATNIQDAFNVLEKHHEINLLILDIQLNDILDGIDFYKQLPHKIPVIYLTAYADEITIDRAIKTHPLGYLIKPLNEKELFALLKLTAFKRNTTKQKNKALIQLPSGYAYDSQHEILFHNQTRVKIKGKKLQLFKLLLEAKGEYIPFEIIEDELYKDNPPSESSLRTLIYRLRTELQYEMIETKRAYGIRLRV